MSTHVVRTQTNGEANDVDEYADDGDVAKGRVLILENTASSNISDTCHHTHVTTTGRTYVPTDTAHLSSSLFSIDIGTATALWFIMYTNKHSLSSCGMSEMYLKITSFHVHVYA